MTPLVVDGHRLIMPCTACMYSARYAISPGKRPSAHLLKGSRLGHATGCCCNGLSGSAGAPLDVPVNCILYLVHTRGQKSPQPCNYYHPSRSTIISFPPLQHPDVVAVAALRGVQCPCTYPWLIFTPTVPTAVTACICRYDVASASLLFSHFSACTVH